MQNIISEKMVAPCGLDCGICKGALPVYIHTQPWSWKAILLYLSLGFRLQKTDTFSHYENEYGKALAELRKIVSEEQYEMLLRLSED